MCGWCGVVCRYYQGFIESIDELLKVRQSAVELKEMIDEANESLKISGDELTDKMQKLVVFRQIQRNILITIEALANCLSVVQLYCKAVNHIKQNKFYPALKTLRDLEIIHLTPSVKYVVFG